MRANLLIPRRAEPGVQAELEAIEEELYRLERENPQRWQAAGGYEELTLTVQGL